MNAVASLRRAIAPAIGILAALVAAGGDEPARTIEAQGVKFEAPKTWKSSTPSSRMRLAELKVDPVDGDDFPAELVVYAFPGGAGTVDDNIKRWRNQFKDKTDNVPEAEVKKVKCKNIEATRVETSGRYHPASFGAKAEPDRDSARLLGAIIVTDRVSYFIKMVGPDKTMTKIRPEFDALLATLTVKNE